MFVMLKGEDQCVARTTERKRSRERVVSGMACVCHECAACVHIFQLCFRRASVLIVSWVGQTFVGGQACYCRIPWYCVVKSDGDGGMSIPGTIGKDRKQMCEQAMQSKPNLMLSYFDRY